MTALMSRLAFSAALFCWSLKLLDAAPISPFDADGRINGAISQPDGKVIVFGAFVKIGDFERPGIARLNANGTVDPTFHPDPQPDFFVRSVALQSDGKVLIAGSSTTTEIWRGHIKRLLPDGSADPSFDAGTGSAGYIEQLRVDSSDRVVIAGSFDSFNGIPRMYLARLQPNGHVDSTFNAGKMFSSIAEGSGVLHLAFCPDGQLLAGGIFQADGVYDFVRVAVNGTVDHSFVAKAISPLFALQIDGKIVTQGYVNGSSGNTLQRLNVDGQTDSTFQASQGGRMMSVQPDGRILLEVANGSELHRLNADGTNDPTFNVARADDPNPVQFFGDTALQPNGRILVVGRFRRVNGVPRKGIARLLANGSVDPDFIAPPSIGATGSVLNLSTRGVVGTGDHVLIGGFIVAGDAPKKVIVRAIGPSLSDAEAPVGTPLPDPHLVLHDSGGQIIAQNDDWRTTVTGNLISSDQESDIEATGIAPRSDRESAVIVTLAPGAYTAVVQGGGTGTALVELYDLDGSKTTRIANISTRGDVAAGDDVLIAGAVIGGDSASEVLIRAIGPSLASAGVQDLLVNPTLSLYDSNGFQLAVNNDWKDTQEADIKSTEAAPLDDKESAIVIGLWPGNYTAVVRGENNTTGVALVEFYAF